jgi:hypothetical protein
LHLPSIAFCYFFPDRTATDFGCVFDPLVPSRLLMVVDVVVGCDAVTRRAEGVRFSRVLGGIAVSSNNSCICYLRGLFLCSCRRVAPQGKHCAKFVEFYGVRAEFRQAFLDGTVSIVRLLLLPLARLVHSVDKIYVYSGFLAE